MVKKISTILLLIVFLLNSNMAFLESESNDYTTEIDENNESKETSTEINDDNPYFKVINEDESDDQYFVDTVNKLYYKWDLTTFLRTDPYGIEKDKNLKINSIASNGKIFVAVGNDNLILTSTDNKKWSKISDDPFRNLYGNFKKVIWTGKAFLAFSNNIRGYAYSEDGITWSVVSFERDYSIYNAYIFNSKVYLTCTEAQYGFYAPKPMILVSLDGKKWTRGNFKNIQGSSMMGPRPLYTLAYNGKMYLAAGNSGTLATSTDGLNWTGIDTSKEAEKVYNQRKIDDYYSYNAYYLEFESLIWDGKRFIGSGTESNTGVDIPRIIASKDGKKWTVLSKWGPEQSNYNLQWNGKEYYLTTTKWDKYEPEVFDSASFYTSHTNVMISKDAKTWNKITEFKSFSTGTYADHSLVINGKVYLFGNSIYSGTRIDPASIPKDAKKISLYKKNSKKIVYPRFAYNIFSNPNFSSILCTSIDDKPLTFPKDHEPFAYKETGEKRDTLPDVDVLYPVDIILEYVNGELIYDNATGFYICKYNGREKFRIKPDNDNFTYKNSDGTTSVKSFKKYGRLSPKIRNGKIYMNIDFIMDVFGRTTLFNPYPDGYYYKYLKN